MMSTVSEKLLQVAENVPKVYHAGQLNIIENAECLKGNASGSAILIDDASPVTHEMGVKVRSKNLWQNTNTTFPTALSYDSATQTYTIGTGTTGFVFMAHKFTNPIPVGTTVTISIMFQSGKGRGVAIGGYHRTGGTSWQGYINVPPNVDMTGQTLTSTFITTETVEEFMVFHNTGDNIKGPFIFKVQYEIGSTATAYTPYVLDLTAVKISRYGKNLFDKSIPISNYTTLDNSYKYLKYYVGIGTNVTVSIAEKPTVPNDNGFMYVYPNATPKPDGNAKWLAHQTVNALCNQQQTVVSTDGYICLVVSVARALDHYGNSIQLELGSKATAYEPYIIPTAYIPTVDGVVSGITSLYPNTTLTADTEGVIIDCNYYKDIDKTFNELTTSVALSGGDS